MRLCMYTQYKVTINPEDADDGRYTVVDPV